MNSFLKYLLVGVVFFLAGVVATNFFFRDEEIQIKSNLSEAQKLKVAEKELRKPLFIQTKEASVKLMEDVKSPNDRVKNPEALMVVSTIKSQGDFLKITIALEKFNMQMNSFLKDRFKTTYQMDAEGIETKIIASVQGENLRELFYDDRLFYKAVVGDVSSETSLVLFFNYTKCDQAKKDIKIIIKNICYELNVFNKQNEMWHTSMISSGVDGLLWQEGISYAYINMSNVGDFSSKSGSPIVIIPTPDQKEIYYLLNYLNQKFSWVEGSEVRWNISTAKELEAFHNNIYKSNTANNGAQSL